jgi:ribosomal protein S18 acetylase RimI-like enzyme
MNFSLRAVTEADYPWLWALKRETMRPYVEQTWGGWEETAQEEFFRRQFVPSNLQAIVIEGRDAGLLHVERDASGVFLANIQISPAFQNRGVGTTIVRELLAEAQAGGTTLRLQVLKTNLPARRLYERLGFEVIEQTGIHYQMRAQVPAGHFQS